MWNCLIFGRTCDSGHLDNKKFNAGIVMEKCSFLAIKYAYPCGSLL